MQCGSEYLQLAQIRRPQHSHTHGIAFVSSTGRMSNWHPRHCFGVALSAASYSMHSASFFFSSSSHAVSVASSLCSSADEEKGDVVFDITYITLLVGSIIKILHGGVEVTTIIWGIILRAFGRCRRNDLGTVMYPQKKLANQQQTAPWLTFSNLYLLHGQRGSNYSRHERAEAFTRR